MQPQRNDFTRSTIDQRLVFVAGFPVVFSIDWIEFSVLLSLSASST